MVAALIIGIAICIWGLLDQGRELNELREENEKLRKKDEDDKAV